MLERGVVVESGRGKARVRIQRSEACEGCHGCLMKDTDEYVEAEVVDRLGASPGDRVCIETEGVTPMKASLLLFGMPLLLLFVGYAVGAALASAFGAPAATQGIGIAGAALFFAASFGVLLLITRRQQAAGTGPRSVIVEVLEHPEQQT